MKISNLNIFVFLSLINGSAINATTIYAVPAEVKMILAPMKDFEIKKDTSFAELKQIASKHWGITIYGYIHAGAPKRNPSEKEWQKDLQEILEKKLDLYLITRPKPQ